MLTVKPLAIVAFATCAIALADARPASADRYRGGICTFVGGVLSCLGYSTKDPGSTHIRKAEPMTAEEAERAAARERKWRAHCRPVIKQDAFGVGRYQYARAGCEFGRSEN